jgi:hypothetical protein
MGTKRYSSSEGDVKMGGYTFPKQKVSQNKKTKEWYKRHLSYAERFIASNTNLSTTYDNMKENYDLRVNKLDIERYKSYINPNGMSMDKFPAEFKHIGIGNAKIDLMLGDYLDLEKDYRAYVSNNDSIGVGNKSDELKEQLTSRLVSLIEDTEIDDKALEKELKEIQNWEKYGFQSVGEKTANAILKREFTEKNYEFTVFLRTFEDLLVSGAPVAWCDIWGKEPIMERIDPRNVFTIGTSDTMYIHDQDVIVVLEYLSPGRIHDRYWDKLTETDATKLERDSHIGEYKYNPHDGYAVEYPVIGSDGEEIEILTIPEYRNINSTTAYRNNNGELRVMTMMWQSRRKIGELSYIDIETGQDMTTYVNEFYIPDEDTGETVKWMWINEWQKAVQVMEDIYLDMGPIEHSSKSMTNISVGMPPIVGITTATNSYRIQSLMDVIKPFDIAYDIGFWKRELEISTYKGRATAINSSMVPAGWDPQQWLHYGMIDKVLFLDPTNEILKGPNQGKAAGIFNTFVTQDVSLGSDIQSIQMLTEYLQNIEYTMGKTTGIHGAREGELGERSAVRNNQVELEQFTKITQKWFAIDNEFRRVLIKKFLEVCKIAYAKYPERGMYLFNNLGQEFIQMSKDFPFYDYDIHIPSSKFSTQLFQELKELAHAAMQNGQARLHDIVEMTVTESPAERLSILRNASEEIAQQQQEQTEAQIAAQKEMAELDMTKSRDKNATDIEVALIQAEAKDRDSIRKNEAEDGNEEENQEDPLAEKKLQQDNFQHKDKLSLEKDKLSETKRSNRAKEGISRMAKKSPVKS